MINQLYISSANHNWNNFQAVALTKNNLDKIINQKIPIDCYTSPEDLSYECLHQACDAAVQIHLIDFDFNDTNFNNFGTYGRLLNELVKQKHKVAQQVPLWHQDLRTTPRPPGPVLWTSGCSFTSGASIPAIYRFGRLVADALGRQEACLARPSASIFWAADQILRADLKSGDIVVWGLTNVPRVEIAKQWKLHPVSIKKYLNIDRLQQYWNLDWFGSSTQTLMTFHYIDQVQNFCKKIGVELYIVNLLDTDWMSVYTAKYANYIDLLQHSKIKNGTVSFIDYGRDNQHPGIAQHQQWADEILKFIKDSQAASTTQ
jgi:hypothetical protein